MTLRRTGFKSKVYTPPPAAPLRRVERSGVIARITAAIAAQPKSEPHRNRHLLGMARGQRCLIHAPGVTCASRDTTVACHSNRAEHGKAGARKSDDEYSVWGCFACHSWLDSGRADGDAKAMTFMRAHLDQVAEWRAIAADPGQPARDRAAAQWALDRLNATPVGLESPL
jgi:hypothetical protein